MVTHVLLCSDWSLVRISIPWDRAHPRSTLLVGTSLSNPKTTYGTSPGNTYTFRRYGEGLCNSIRACVGMRGLYISLSCRATAFVGYHNNSALHCTAVVEVPVSLLLNPDENLYCQKMTQNKLWRDRRERRDSSYISQQLLCHYVS